ncbi:type II toxin-antitoxin system VapB family antitoxin [Sphingomonas sp. CLY1604]|uniref:type II toxin-antitoxin system VapB family antitoxin n=1 Tax=Sphingomonas sp. CLY1604 TaxID=3457786 RepID=UPI003FD7C3B7
MRTNIEIDEQLMAKVMEAFNVTSESAAIDEALRTALRLARQREMHNLRGKVEWDGDLDAMRRD